MTSRPMCSRFRPTRALTLMTTEVASSYIYFNNCVKLEPQAGPVRRDLGVEPPAKNCTCLLTIQQEASTDDRFRLLENYFSSCL